MEGFDAKMELIISTLSKGSTERTMDDFVQEGAALAHLIELRTYIGVLETSLRTFADRAAQPNFELADDDSTVTFFAKDVRAAKSALGGRW